MPFSLAPWIARAQAGEAVTIDELPFRDCRYFSATQLPALAADPVVRAQRDRVYDVVRAKNPEVAAAFRRYTDTPIDPLDFDLGIPAAISAEGPCRLADAPGWSKPNNPLISDSRYLAKVREAVWDLWRSGAVTCTGLVGGVGSAPCFCCALEETIFRLCWNGRPVNRYMHNPPTHLPSVVDLAMESSGAIGVADVKAAYHNFGLTRGLLGFEFDGLYFSWNVPPFGWSPASGITQSVSEAIVIYLRSEFGLPWVCYIDDHGWSAAFSRRHEDSIRAADAAGVIGMCVLLELGF